MLIWKQEKNNQTLSLENTVSSFSIIVFITKVITLHFSNSKPFRLTMMLSWKTINVFSFIVSYYMLFQLHITTTITAEKLRLLFLNLK